MSRFLPAMIIVMLLVVAWRLAPRKEKTIIKRFIKAHVGWLVLVAGVLFTVAALLSFVEIKLF